MAYIELAWYFTVALIYITFISLIVILVKDFIAIFRSK